MVLTSYITATCSWCHKKIKNIKNHRSKIGVLRDKEEEKSKENQGY
jgi:hypothetical protein